MKLCEDCHEREATIHLTQVVGNKQIVLNLCSQCAAKRGFDNPLKNVPFPLGDFLSSMVEKSPSGDSEALQKLVCSGCGMTFSEFRNTGRFGCGKCYEAFHAQLDELLRKVHGANRHSGKFPSGSPERMQPLREERKLQEELRSAIETEDFEKAAELRDRLKAMTADKH